MSGFLLKIIAMITMFIDHYTAIFIPFGTIEGYAGRIIGRIAFPIFCFLIVEGMRHTKDVKKYMLRLGIFGLVSELPFDLAFSIATEENGIWSYQNVFFTLFLGLFVIFCINQIKIKLVHNPLLCSLLQLTFVVLGGFVAEGIRSDYGFVGILMIVTFYFLQDKKLILVFVLFLLNASLGILQGFAVCSMAFIWFYNGERGPKINKYFFYFFYPFHLMLLYFFHMA